MFKKLKNIKNDKANWSRQIVWVLIIGVICLLWAFAINDHKSSNINALRVKVIGANKSENNLLTPKQIHGLVTDKLGMSIKQVQIKDLDLAWLENEIEGDNRIEQAELFLDQRNYLNVEVELRQPMIRVMSSNDKESYYLDRFGERIETMNGVPKRVPVITGDIDPYKKNWKKINAHSLHEVMVLGNAISNDDFLVALTDQIHLDKKGEYKIIPKLGKPCKLGGVDELDMKLENLKELYKQVYPHRGWDEEGIDAIGLGITNQYILEPKNKKANS